MANAPRTSLPDSLQRLRRELGLTQEQLAAQLGVSVRTVSRWEQGESAPRSAGQKQAIREIAQSASKRTASIVALSIGGAVLPLAALPLIAGPLAIGQMLRRRDRGARALYATRVQDSLRVVADDLGVQRERLRKSLASALSAIHESGITLAQIVEQLRAKDDE